MPLIYNLFHYPLNAARCCDALADLEPSVGLANQNLTETQNKAHPLVLRPSRNIVICPPMFSLASALERLLFPA